MIYKGITLDPFQEEAIQHIDQGESVIVAAPTGAGKTLIAEYAIDQAIREGKRLIYTAPIKALSNQKFRDFTQQYGDRIGIKTGDVTLNPDAQVILMTTEIFRNTVFDNPESLHDVRFVVFDEIHYLDDIERGTVWEESIIFAPEHMRIICLSATVPNIYQLAQWIHHVRKSPVYVIQETGRPVPLKHLIYIPGRGVKRLKELKSLEGREDRRRPPVPHTMRWRRDLIQELVEYDRLPALYFAFNRRDCEEFATAMPLNLLNDAEQRQILDLYDDLCRRFAIEPDVQTRHIRALLAKGTAFHHAGLLPTLKEIVERIFSTGFLKLLFATETFAMGVNMPARTVVFDSLHKFNGVSRVFIKTREHQQMSGRAGRRGIDSVGYTYSVVEWPPIRYSTLERIIYGEPEPIRSQFNMSYSILLTSYHHLGDRIFQACKKSFSNFQSRGDRGRGDGHEFRMKLETVEKKLEVLRELGYIEGRQVTEKGHFASRINGYELQVAELYTRGILSELDEDMMNVVMAALVFEFKRNDWYRKPEIAGLDRVRKACLGAVKGVLRAEQKAGLSELSQDIDFRLSGAVYAWSTGCEFGGLEGWTNAADGDLVRTFRLAIQLLRQVLYAEKSQGRHDLAKTLRSSIDKLCRDVVDAERQLRMGVAEVPEEPAPIKES